MQESPKYEELCRRFLADAKDFSEEKLNEAGITRRFVNQDLDETEEENPQGNFRRTGRKEGEHWWILK